MERLSIRRTHIHHSQSDGEDNSGLDYFCRNASARLEKLSVNLINKGLFINWTALYYFISRVVNSINESSLDQIYKLIANQGQASIFTESFSFCRCLGSRDLYRSFHLVILILSLITSLLEMEELATSLGFRRKKSYPNFKP